MKKNKEVWELELHESTYIKHRTYLCKGEGVGDLEVGPDKYVFVIRIVGGLVYFFEGGNTIFSPCGDDFFNLVIFEKKDNINV